eukprot:Lankesteria_metandrocarpae@DN5710_c0_g1_i1.p1
MSDNTHGSANSEERTASTLHEERTASTLHEERTASTLHEERTASTLHEEQNTDHYSSDDSAAEPDNELFDTGSTCDTGDTCLTNRYPIVEFYVPSSDMDEARSSVALVDGEGEVSVKVENELCKCKIDFEIAEVLCEVESVKQTVRTALRRLQTALLPVAKF